MTSKTKEYVKKIEFASFSDAKYYSWKNYKGGIYRIKDYAINTQSGEVDMIMERIAGPGFYEAVREGGADILYTRPFKELEHTYLPYEDSDVEHMTVLPEPKRKWIKVKKVQVDEYLEV